MSTDLLGHGGSPRPMRTLSCSCLPKIQDRRNKSNPTGLVIWDDTML
jgi:hypothetical protein